MVIAGAKVIMPRGVAARGYGKADCVCPSVPAVTACSTVAMRQKLTAFYKLLAWIL